MSFYQERAVLLTVVCMARAGILSASPRIRMKSSGLTYYTLAGSEHESRPTSMRSPGLRTLAKPFKKSEASSRWKFPVTVVSKLQQKKAMGQGSKLTDTGS